MLLALGPHQFDTTHRAIVIGVLGQSPDASSSSGTDREVESLLRTADALVAGGADALDVAAAETGPTAGGDPELERVVAVVEALRQRFELPICVTTRRASVARASYAAGAVVGIDASGFGDPAYLRAAADAGTSVMVTHIGPPGTDPDPDSGDVVDVVVDHLLDRARAAEEVGIPAERIMLDAGLGSGKSDSESLELLRHHDRLAGLGWAVSLSISGAPFLGADADADARTFDADAAHALGVVRGVRVLRVHDVRAARRVADVSAHLLEARDRAQHREVRAS